MTNIITSEGTKNKIFYLLVINSFCTFINIIIVSTSKNLKENNIETMIFIIFSIIILPFIVLFILFISKHLIGIHNSSKLINMIFYLIIIFYLSMIGYGIYIVYSINNHISTNIENDTKNYLSILSSIHLISYVILYYLLDVYLLK